MSSKRVNCQRKGFVSLWIGSFPSLEAAEAYFGIPDEIGVYLPPESFARDLGLDDVPAECLEVNFEQLSPRPLCELLKDASFSVAFLAQAVTAATQQGIEVAQGIALLYDFDYQAKPGWQSEAGPLRFIGSFPFAQTAATQEPNAQPDPRLTIREIMDDVW